MPPIPSEQRSPFGSTGGCTESDFPPLAYRMNDAVRVSGVSRSKLYQLAADGRLKLTRVGGRTLVPHAELQRLIDEGLVS